MIQEILKRVKKDIYTQKSSINLSKKIGDGYDFAELNLYQYGEDAKKIDWKSTAKTQTPHIKRYYQEKEANIILAPILTPTLNFLDKKEIFYQLISILGYEIIRSSNNLNINVINGNKTIPYKKSKNPSLIKKVLSDLKKIEFSKEKTNLKDLSKQIKKSSIILLIGDFLDPIDLKELAIRHEIFVFIIRDEFEQNPTILGEREFIDLKTSKTKNLFFGKKELKEWRDGYEKSDKALFSYLKTLSIPYIKIVGKQSPSKQLYGLKNL